MRLKVCFMLEGLLQIKNEGLVNKWVIKSKARILWDGRDMRAERLNLSERAMMSLYSGQQSAY